MFKMEQKKPKPVISINVVFKSGFSNVRNNDAKCPYLLRPKDEHFTVVLYKKWLCFDFVLVKKVLNLLHEIIVYRLVTRADDRIQMGCDFQMPSDTQYFQTQVQP